MIELESDKERAGCDDDSCLADLAGALGARYVIYGTLGKLGSRYVTTLNLFDAELGKAINRSDVQADSMDVVSDRLDAALQDLIAPIAVANSSTLAEGDNLGALQNAEGASSNALEPNAPSAGANPFSLLLMGGGGLIFGLSYASSLFLSGVTPLVAVPVAGPLFVPFFGDASNFNPANFSVCCTCSAVQAAGLGLLLGGWLLSGGDKKSEPKTPDDQAFFLAPAAPSLSMAY